MEWQDYENEQNKPPKRVKSTDVAIVVFIIASLIVASFLVSVERITSSQPPPSKNLTEPNLLSLSEPPLKPETKSRIVVNVTEIRYISADWVMISGNVKNFTDKTYQTLSLRFNFYDRNDNLIHTETRHIIIFERFRPLDVRSFNEQFFFLPPKTKKVEVQVEEAIPIL